MGDRENRKKQRQRGKEGERGGGGSRGGLRSATGKLGIQRLEDKKKLTEKYMDNNQGIVDTQTDRVRGTEIYL